MAVSALQETDVTPVPVERTALERVKRAWASVKDWRMAPARFRWWAVRAMMPRGVVESRGLRFTLQCENWITQYRCRTYNDKEPETLDWIDERLREGDTFFDIGANIGVYALYAALRHPRLKVVAFEPEYANLHLLRDNLFHNALQDRVDVYAIALSARSGVSWLHIQDLAPGSGLHTEFNGGLGHTLEGRRVVWREGIVTLTLDEFCRHTGLQPNGLKIDVDGTEPRILEGARRTLGSPALRSVIIEIPEDVSARRVCEEQLCAAGLTRRWRDPRGLSQNEIWGRNA